MDLSLPTLGGKQFWTDVRIDSGWRIQQHALTGSFRLLDDHDRRRAAGTWAECEAAWHEMAPATADREGREVVVLLHGLGRTRGAMQPLADALEDAGFAVANAGYASTRQPVTAHAEALSSIVAHLAGYSRVHFVGHSLGNLVVRRYLALRAQDPAAHPGPPVGRVVMLAPPNNGSALAKRLKDNLAFRLALGPSGQEIAQWDALPAMLATPPEFGVIAGDCSRIGNPLLGADGDLVVSVEETRLPGSRDFACLDATHTFLMRNPEAMRMTENFLRTGRFSTEGADPAN